jgi:hypothetical protein
MDLFGISYWRLLSKFVEEFQICLMLGKNIQHFTWRPKNTLLLLVKLNQYKSALSSDVVSAC